MNPSSESKIPLPLPDLVRWQPLRLGVVNLFYYDSEEFGFCNGHLLLRGNNGTGKSKVLSLTLPLLFDAQLRSSRVEPDGDAGKKMAWNLLLGKHDRRIGYSWIEFGRIDEHGVTQYLTLGCGIYAAAGRAQMESWFFLSETHRIGQDLWLTSPQGVVLTKERLKVVLGAHGQIFPNQDTYRRAVDERLFQLGPMRYSALMDTLIQLRQPQLSKKPDEENLSNALTEALPPLAPELLSDVADAMSQLEEDRRQLYEFDQLAVAVDRFNVRYSVYAKVHSRRQARLLRSAQTAFDNASRDLNQARADLVQQQEKERRAIDHHDASDLAWQSHRARHEELLSDPAMQDAARIENLKRECQSRQADLKKAEKVLAEADEQLQREGKATAVRHATLARAGERVASARGQQHATAQVARLESALETNALMASSNQELLAFKERALHGARDALRAQGLAQRDRVKLIQRRSAEVVIGQQDHDRKLQALDEVRGEMEEAAAQRELADAAITHEGGRLIGHWQHHFDSLRILQIDGAELVMERLGHWVLDLASENPATAALLDAHHTALQHLADTKARLDVIHDRILAEQTLLDAESLRLQNGEDTQPIESPFRTAGARANRSGAPLWQLVEFNESLTLTERAGLEAALEAAGLLDAWVTPEGTVLAADEGGTPLPPLHDAQLLARPPVQASLASWLHPADTRMPVAPAIVKSVLAGISCGAIDDGIAETWVAKDGRFRLGALTGSWSKPTALFIGFAAREAARKQRLEDIATRSTELLMENERNNALLERNTQDNHEATQALRGAPADTALRQAYAQAAARAQTLRDVRARHDRLEKAYQEALVLLQQARGQLEQDALDLHLPVDATELAAIDAAVSHFIDGLSDLASAIRELLTAIPEYQAQLEREAAADATATQAQQELGERRQQATQAQARLDILLESAGAKVEELLVKLGEARQRMEAAETTLKQANTDQANAAQLRVRSEMTAENLNQVYLAAAESRLRAVEAFQQFAKNELIAIAVPDVDIPDVQSPWTIEPALTLARRVEQALSAITDDTPTWERIQKLVSQDFTDLQRTLGALRQQAQAETSDQGLIVSIIYQNRLMRPDQLSNLLTEEISQRRELLSAREREILENHLQAEIAAAVQLLMRDAVHHVDAINLELEKRPTSTGVKFCLQWQPLPEGAEGAPVGLEAARKRLLNTSTDLWTPEDRRVVGTLLQQRIAAERERADAVGGGGMLDQLKRALDYRRWHRFAVQRWQDGQWRKLSGPASSGERALGLTVPLFAAVASFYNHGGYALAPRLVLLDEAFAGIDDDARAHCMGLIKEFDLDFVITSEREWACYATLPGVSICQLQRRPGIDAIHVSRWTWNGKSKLPGKDPDRRFPGGSG